MTATADCPLCGDEKAPLFWRQTEGLNFRDVPEVVKSSGELLFFSCPTCKLVFKDARAWPAPEAEKNHYLTHENSSGDPRYRSYIERQLQPLLPFLKPGMRGLDFGCGPARTLEEVAKAKGFECASYDPYFHHEPRVLAQKYDFIVCSESAEHFYSPMTEFMRLRALLLPKGYIAVLSAWPPENFERWHYHRDPTHVVFYSEATFDWLARQLRLSLVKSESGVAILQARS